MSIRFAVAFALLTSIQPGVVAADEDSDKLDAILQEIRLLNARVRVLERRVEQLSGERPVRFEPKAPRPVVEPIMMLPGFQPMGRPRHSTPSEVIRMQSESPGTLFNNIHERERLLRQRRFPAESGFISP